MKVWINPDSAPLKNVPASMRERRLNELVNELRSRGVEVSGGDDPNSINLNLRNLATKNGTLERGQQALMQALGELGAERVDVSAADVEYIEGRNPYSRGIARGLESNIPALQQRLTALEPDELFDALDSAANFVANDRFTGGGSDELNGHLRQNAAFDMERAGIMGANYGPLDTRDALEPKAEVVPELPEEFRADVQPYRSPFDTEVF